MAKESLVSLDRRLIFRETFNSYSDIVKNWGTIIGNPTLSNGVMSFLAANTDKIEYPRNKIDFSGRTKFTVRVKWTVVDGVTLSLQQYTDGTNRVVFVKLADNYLYFIVCNATGSFGKVSLSSGTYDIVFVYDGGGTGNAGKMKVYVGGVLQTLTFTANIPASCPTFTTEKFTLGLYSTVYSTGDINLIDIYENDSTAEEALALANDRLYVPPSIEGTVLDIDPRLGSIVDRWGNTITNTAVDIVRDTPGYVMSFDGGTSKLDCGNPASLQITGSITLSAWVKFNGSGTQFIIAKDDNTNRDYGLYTSGGSIYMLIFISGAAKQASTTAATFNDNQWHRIIGINNGTDLLVYVDGKLEPSTGGSGNGGVIDNDTVNLTIGVRANDSSDYLGLLGNVNINNKAWSAEEVARDYHSTKHYFINNI